MMRALAFHQCGLGSIPGFYAICGLSLLVIYSALRGFSPGTPVFPSPQKPTFAGVAQLGSARLSEQGVPISILGDFSACFDFPLIRVAIALNIRETEHRQREGGWVKGAPSASIDTSFVTEGTTDLKYIDLT